MQKIIIPGIIVGLIGGILLFFAAYNFYPHKNVNIDINGDCYEFLGKAYALYKNLENTKERELLRMQIQAIEDPNAMVPIAFSGSQVQVDSILNSSKLTVTNRQTFGDNQTHVDKIIIKGLANLSLLQTYYQDWNTSSSKNQQQQTSPKIGILPNKFISLSESDQIEKSVDRFMVKGIERILGTKDGIKPTECRSAIVYHSK